MMGGGRSTAGGPSDGSCRLGGTHRSIKILDLNISGGEPWDSGFFIGFSVFLGFLGFLGVMGRKGFS